MTQTQCTKCKVFFKRINLHTASKCTENQQKSNVNTNGMELNESKATDIEVNRSLLDELVMKIDVITKSNCEMIKKIDFLYSKINDFEHKINECINISVVKDSNNQFLLKTNRKNSINSVKNHNSKSSKVSSSQNANYINTNKPTARRKVNKKLYITGLNDKHGNDQYHMLQIFNCLSTDGPMYTKRVTIAKCSSQVVLATFYSPKTIKSALERVSHLQKLFGYENIRLFENYLDVKDELICNEKENANQSYTSTQSTKQTNNMQKNIMHQPSMLNETGINVCANQTIDPSHCSTSDASIIINTTTNSTSIKPNTSNKNNCKQNASKKKGKSQINQKDYETLDPKQMLNDTIVNSYLSLIERSDTICLSSFLAAKFLKSDYKSTKNWFNSRGLYGNYDLKSITQIIIPICLNMHWTLLIIDVVNKSYSYYNSAEASFGLDVHSIKLILDGIYYNFNHISDLKKLTLPTVPKQENGFDCGMFICLYARYYLSNDHFTFNQSMISRFRLHFVNEIVNQRLNSIVSIDSLASNL